MGKMVKSEPPMKIGIIELRTNRFQPASFPRSADNFSVLTHTCRRPIKIKTEIMILIAPSKAFHATDKTFSVLAGMNKATARTITAAIIRYITASFRIFFIDIPYAISIPNRILRAKINTNVRIFLTIVNLAPKNFISAGMVEIPIKIAVMMNAKIIG